MKRKFYIIIIALFSIAAICLVAIQAVMTSSTLAISDNMFNISVSSAMDEVTGQLNRLRVEDYISQKDRYKLIKYRRIEDLNQKMNNLVRDNSALFYDENKVSLGVAMQDSAICNRNASEAEMEIINRYNQLLGNRNKLSEGSEFYDVFLSEISNFVVDNLMSETSFNYARLDSMICESLIEKGIDIRPIVGVMNTSDNSFLYIGDSSRREQMLLSPYRYSFHLKNASTSAEYYIVLLFPKSALFFRDSMTLYIISSAILLVIIISLFAVSVRTNSKQRKLDVMKNDFVNNMTHEIKTPIATINLACEMLLDKSISTDPASQETFINMISSENHRMRMLVETILQSSKMASKKFQMNIHEIDIHPIIENVCKSFSLTVKNRGGKIEKDLSAIPSTLFADELHITNMVYNLIDNAIKYSPQELHIIIRTTRKDNNIVLQVQDHGQGISREAQKHIFEKFYRVSQGDVHDVKGFGIGLNYVQQVVNLHQGNIEVASEIGQGTTFTITLPVE